MGKSGRTRKIEKKVAECIFLEVKDVVEFFDKNPDKLVSYISTAFNQRVAVMAVHLTQLSVKVGVPLRWGGREFGSVKFPELYYGPFNFDNINQVISAGRRMYPSLVAFR